jgi:hypothetical protein
VGDGEEGIDATMLRLVTEFSSSLELLAAQALKRSSANDGVHITAGKKSTPLVSTT